MYIVIPFLIITLAIVSAIWFLIPPTYKAASNKHLMTAEPDTLVAGDGWHVVTFTYREHKNAIYRKRVECWQDGVNTSTISVTPTEARVEIFCSPKIKGKMKFELLGTRLVGYIVFE